MPSTVSRRWLRARLARSETTDSGVQQGGPGGRILVDTGRNGYSATFAAPYAVRAKPGAPISAPCTWEEVEKEVHPQTFTMRTVADRINAVGDLWTDMRKRKYPIVRRTTKLKTANREKL